MTTAQPASRVDLDAIQQAAKILEPVIHRTPIETSSSLAAHAGVPVYLKCENLQRSGSFKLRGAYVRLARLSAEQRQRGVIAASAGNHAQGVALAARELGIDATVFMPTDAALPKVAATRDYGARVQLAGATVDETIEVAARAAQTSGAEFIHPFDHPDVIAGQGTIGLELVEQIKDLRTVLVPTGGGGLLAGIAIAIKALNPQVRVIGVQAAQAAAYPYSLSLGRPVSVGEVSTMADGIAVATPGELPFGFISKLVDGMITVSEEQISQALLFVAERAKLTVEPAAAVAVAAIQSSPKISDGPIAAVLSGGNVDPIVLLRLLRHGLSSAGRYVQLRIRVPDRPGALANLLSHIASTGANVMHIDHARAGLRLELDEVELGLQLETKGPDHCDYVVAQISAAGFVVEVAGA